MTEHHGYDRRKKTEMIHSWRWKGLAVWIVIFTAIVFVSLDQLAQNKASVASLEKTNCALRSFLGSAYEARIKTANDPKQDPTSRKTARQAAAGYYKLYVLFPHDGCKDVINRAGRK